MKKLLFGTFYYKKGNNLSIYIYLDEVLLLGSPVSSSKGFEKSPARRRLPRLLLPANSVFPGKCHSQEQLSDRRN